MVEKLGLGENGTMGSFVPLRAKDGNRYTVWPYNNELI